MGVARILGRPVDESPDTATDRERAPDRLRAAVERTFAEAIDSATQGGERTRERAQELVDDVVRRGQEASRELARRSQDAREVSSSLAQRAVEAVQDIRPATVEDLREINVALDDLRHRLAALERESR